MSDLKNKSENQKLTSKRFFSDEEISTMLSPAEEALRDFFASFIPTDARGWPIINIGTNEIVCITEEVLYTVADQQAFALTKAWIALRSAQHRIHTDDSNDGILVVSGDVNFSINKDNGLFPHYFLCCIFVANGIAKLEYTAYFPYCNEADQTNTQNNVKNALNDHVIPQTKRTFIENFHETH